jgi:hypothetical protein
MEQHFDIPRLLELRKLTTALSLHFEQELKEHLVNLTPLLDPKSLLGDHIRAAKTHSVRDADRAFQQLRRLYQSIATIKPFSLPADLTSPLDIFGVLPATAVADYTYSVQSNGSTKEITVTKPLKWVLTYKGMGPKRLRDLIASQSSGSTTDLVVCILHCLVTHFITSQRSGIAPILNALRFPISSGPAPEFGGLPLTYVSCPITTIRPPDDIIVEITDISGKNVFEEVVSLQDIKDMSDPLKEQVVAIVKEHSEGLFSEVGL